MKRWVKLFIRKEEGFAAILFVVLLPVLIAFSGLILDGGLLMYNKAKLEAASEAAVLSTIAAYDVSIWESTGTIVINEYNATQYARNYLNLNLPAASVITCEVDAFNPAKVTLTTQISVKMVFAKLFGVNEKTIKTQVISYGRAP